MVVAVVQSQACRVCSSKTLTAPPSGRKQDWAVIAVQGLHKCARPIRLSRAVLPVILASGRVVLMDPSSELVLVMRRTVSVHYRQLCPAGTVAAGVQARTGPWTRMSWSFSTPCSSSRIPWSRPGRRSKNASWTPSSRHAAAPAGVSWDRVPCAVSHPHVHYSLPHLSITDSAKAFFLHHAHTLSPPKGRLWVHGCVLL